MKKINIIIISIIVFIVASPVYAKTFSTGSIKYDWENINVRTCPSTSCGLVKSKLNNEIKLDYPDTFKILGTEGSYYHIEFYYGGYVYTGYITTNTKYVNAKTYTIDDNYVNSLKKQGYPDDYAERIAMLHAMHPNWKFVISKTGDQPNGLDFYYAVDQERSKGLSNNLINGNDTSLRSTEAGAYNENGWITYSGGWYVASRQTLAFFMDPRNFLDETYVFMFEDLAYDKTTHTPEAVSNITSGTFMDNSFECNINSSNCSVGKHTYNSAFVDAGSNKGVSPISLAARVLQEQGVNGSSLSKGEGYKGQYVGYYNLFNIYANGDSESDVVLNGLSYAKKMNWNNPYARILAGADLLGNKYIKVGQNTLYYEKYNTVGSYDLYTHQYMQNVKAPYTESYSTYEGYRRIYDSNSKDWTNSVYTFVIPVYSNMPAYTSLSETLSNDASLKSLNVTNCTMNPGFDPNAVTYDCYIKNEINSVTVTAQATNKYAKVSGIGTVNTTNDTTTSVVVTAADTTKRTYTIKIHKLPKEETTNTTVSDVLKTLKLNKKDNYLTNFTVGQDISNTINSFKNSYPTGSITTSHNTGLVKTGDTISITINNTTTNYTALVYGDINGDGKIDLSDFSYIKLHVLNKTNLTGLKFKAADVNKDGKLNLSDFSYIKLHVLGKNKINQN